MHSASVALRVDSSVRTGSGHLMRCLTLATELRERGAQVRFVSREQPGHLIERIEGAGYVVHRLPARQAAWSEDARETLQALGEGCDWLVVDHYGLDAGWEKLVRPVAQRLLVIDDLADRPHQADLLLDQNYLGASGADRYANRVPQDCRRLLGPRYSLLQPIYRQMRRVLPPRRGAVRRIMVFFGAHDATRSMVSVLQALGRPEFAQIAIDAIPGSDPETLAAASAMARGLPQITVHERLPSLAGLIARADLAIGAGGTTTWECACLGLPTIIATIADNQVEIAKTLAADGCALLLGPAAAMSDEAWLVALRQAVGDEKRLASFGRHAWSLTDGHGTGRVAHAMLGSPTGGIRLRAAEVADEQLLLDWANDPVARRFSFSNVQITGDEHHGWFTRRLTDADCTILMAEDVGGLPLGQVRFQSDRSRREATLHISVEPVARGVGVGRSLLRDAIAAWRKRTPDFTLVAEVVAENEASTRLFRAANFQAAPPRRPHSVAFRLPPGSRVS
jgi:UDP-2,4-diacetamido-2,4,6-trideoxy-beta-L-altropyranose hydrolase